jgi:aerobic carbon-monoxide dehydrogenase medium subunit
MKPFEYLEPGTVGEATKLLSDLGEKARILAGGIDLLPRMRRGDLDADYVINIQKIPGLGEIVSDGKEGITFGAMSRLRTIEVSKPIRETHPILYEAIHQITSVQTKYMGTAVGNLCIATPASDVATVLFALGAQLKIAGPGGERTVPVDRFYAGYRLTCLQRGEMVTEVSLPRPQPGTGSAFLNLVRTHADIAKISVAAVIVVRDGVCREARIGIGAVAPTVIRANKAEALLSGRKVVPELIDQAARTAAGETSPITDLRSTAEYRREMARVLVRRVLEKALERAE